jgi:hypothetical protein
VPRQLDDLGGAHAADDVGARVAAVVEAGCDTTLHAAQVGRVKTGHRRLTIVNARAIDDMTSATA